MIFATGDSCAAINKEAVTDFALLIENSISNIPAALWNGQVPVSNLLMQYNYLQLIETSQGKNLRFKYVIVKQNDSIAGVIYFQIIRFNGKDLLNYFPTDLTGIRKFLCALLKTISTPVFTTIKADILDSGNIFMTGESGFYFNHGLSLPTQAALLRKAIAEIKATDKNIDAAIVSDLYEPKTVFNRDFKSCDFNEISLEPDMSITLDKGWKDFNNYMNALSSKYRVRAKKVFTVNKEHNIIQRELTWQEIEKYEDRLYELYLGIMNKAEFKLGIFTKDYFRLQKQQLPDSYRVFAYFKDEELLGFISIFLLDTKLEVHYIGMDAEKSKTTHLYQRMMYDMIEIGITHQLNNVQFGRTAPEIKSTIGAVPEATFGYVKHFNPFINLLIRFFTKYLRPPQYTYRNPFKS